MDESIEGLIKRMCVGYLKDGGQRREVAIRPAAFDELLARLEPRGTVPVAMPSGRRYVSMICGSGVFRVVEDDQLAPDSMVIRG